MFAKLLHFFVTLLFIASKNAFLLTKHVRKGPFRAF